MLRLSSLSKSGSCWILKRLRGRTTTTWCPFSISSPNFQTAALSADTHVPCDRGFGNHSPQKRALHEGGVVKFGGPGIHVHAPLKCTTHWRRNTSSSPWGGMLLLWFYRHRTPQILLRNCSENSPRLRTANLNGQPTEPPPHNAQHVKQWLQVSRWDCLSHFGQIISNASNIKQVVLIMWLFDMYMQNRGTFFYPV